MENSLLMLATLIALGEKNECLEIKPRSAVTLTSKENSDVAKLLVRFEKISSTELNKLLRILVEYKVDYNNWDQLLADSAPSKTFHGSKV